MAAKKSKRKYSKGSQNEVKKEMHRFKKGTAKSGRGGVKVKSKEQAVAIGLSKARKKGMKAPKKAAGNSKTVKKHNGKSKAKAALKKSSVAKTKAKTSSKKHKVAAKAPVKSKKTGKSLFNIFSW